MKDRQEPLKCLECGHSGHHRASCSHWTSPQLKTRVASHSTLGLFACLVGEVRWSIPTWDHILSGLHCLLPESGIPDYHRLALGDIFLWNLSRLTWGYLRGWRQHLPEGGSICWCRPRLTDGAVSSPPEGRRLQLRGVPFSLQT